MIKHTIVFFLAHWHILAAYALISGVDSSSLISQALYQKAKGEGFTKAIIRGYYEACLKGGAVDPNFVNSYKNARAAGFANIDTYLFPCTGSAYKCKPFFTQIAELGATFKANSMQIGTIWIDIEVDTDAKYGCIGNWDYGNAGNLNVAKALVAAAKASGYKFGIYSGPGEWSQVFGSYNVVLDSTLPLWFSVYDDVQSLTVTPRFGGWTSAVGKQYTDQSASGQFDLDVFAA